MSEKVEIPMTGDQPFRLTYEELRATALLVFYLPAPALPLLDDTESKFEKELRILGFRGQILYMPRPEEKRESPYEQTEAD